MPTGESKETDELRPRNPYSASKAGADRLAYSYFATYQVPVIVTRASNNYGPYQFPEKVIPLFITNAHRGPGAAALRRRPERARLAARRGPLPRRRPDHRDGRDRRGLQHRRRQRGAQRRADEAHPAADRQARVAHPPGGGPAGPRPPLRARARRNCAAWAGRRSTRSRRASRATVAWYRDNPWWWQPIKHQDAAFKAYYQAQYAGARQDIGARSAATCPADEPSSDRSRHRRRRVRRLPPAGSPRRRGRPHRGAPQAGHRGRDAGALPADRVARGRAARSRRRAARHRPSSAPPMVYHLAGSPHVGQSWKAATETLAVNVLATHHLLEALRGAGLRSRVVIPSSAYVYAPADHALTEDDPIESTSPYAISKIATEMAAAKASARDGIPVVDRAVVQSHRPAAGPVVLRLRRGAADRADRSRPARAGDQGRQSRGPARLHRRARHGPRVPRPGRARRRRAPRTTSARASRTV